ncbi:hypothetical protein CGQ13_36715, partial [Pseudomonas aeruginosa]
MGWRAPGNWTGLVCPWPAVKKNAPHRALWGASTYFSRMAAADVVDDEGHGHTRPVQFPGARHPMLRLLPLLLSLACLAPAFADERADTQRQLE